MKVAFSSMDGEKISAHFGRSKYFIVVEIEEGKIVNKEIRENPHAREGGHEGKEHGHHQHHHSHHHQHHQDHSWISNVLGDCHLVVTKSLGYGARQNLEALGKKVVITKSSEIEEALKELEKFLKA